MHILSFVFDGKMFATTFLKTLRDEPGRAYGV
jgi:hypothetical protein